MSFIDVGKGFEKSFLHILHQNSINKNTEYILIKNVCSKNVWRSNLLIVKKEKKQL